MSPREFVEKWGPKAAKPVENVAMYDDLRELVNVYCTIAEKGARADAFAVAADMIVKLPAVALRKEVATKLNEMAKAALGGVQVFNCKIGGES